MLAALASNIKLAWKVLGRRKFFTFVSLFGIAFTLMVLVVQVAILDHLLAAGPPEVNQQRTLIVQRTQLSGHGNTSGANVGLKFFREYLRDLPGVERLSYYTNTGDVSSRLRNTRSALKRTDSNYWKILQFDFLEGGPFSEDDVLQRRFVAVITRGTADKHFGDGPALGKAIEIDGQRFRVIGVVKDVSPLRKVGFADIWAPLSTEKQSGGPPELLGVGTALVLLRDRSVISAAQAALRQRLLHFENPDPRTFTLFRAPMETHFDGVAREMFGGEPDDIDYGARLWAVIVALAACFLLLPTVNLVNLNVSRILERAPEIGVRKSFGATGRSLVGQFLIENLVLTLLGAAAGMVLAVFVLRALSGTDLLPQAELQVNPRVAAMGVALAILFGLVSGVYPAWRMSRLHPVHALKGGER
jgi:putative ABC transport system permease protein